MILGIEYGNRQTIETLINEEALLFAMFIRDELETWKPRIPKILDQIEFHNMQLLRL